jgi:hypothetical protein
MPAIRRSRATLEANDRARRAVSEFRKLQPTLTAYARNLTGKKDVRVEMSASSNGSTDGTKIYFKPPIKLGDISLMRHDRNLCNRRNSETLELLCQACELRETVLTIIYHEISHIAFDSFAVVTMADADQALAMIKEIAPEWYYERVERAFRANPDILYGKKTFAALAQAVNPYFKLLVNALEDVRINERMAEARPGTRLMQHAKMLKVASEGVEQKNNEGRTVWVHWSEYPTNHQACLAALTEAAGYGVNPAWFEERVLEALADPQLKTLLAEVTSLTGARSVFAHSFKIFLRFRELGFFLLKDEELPPPPDAPEGEQSEDEQEQADSNERDGGDSGGDGRDESPDDSGSDNADADGDTDDADTGDDAPGGSEEGDSGDTGDGADDSGGSDSGEAGDPDGGSNGGSSGDDSPNGEAGEDNAGGDPAGDDQTSPSGGDGRELPPGDSGDGSEASDGDSGRDLQSSEEDAGVQQPDKSSESSAADVAEDSESGHGDSGNEPDSGSDSGSGQEELQSEDGDAESDGASGLDERGDDSGSSERPSENDDGDSGVDGDDESAPDSSHGDMGTEGDRSGGDDGEEGLHGPDARSSDDRASSADESAAESDDDRSHALRGESDNSSEENALANEADDESSAEDESSEGTESDTEVSEGDRALPQDGTPWDKGDGDSGSDQESSDGPGSEDDEGRLGSVDNGSDPLDYKPEVESAVDRTDREFKPVPPTISPEDTIELIDLGLHPEIDEPGDDTPSMNKAVDNAIIQSIYFEQPSQHIVGLRVWKYDEREVDVVTRPWHSWGGTMYSGSYSSRRGQRIDPVGEDILGPALMRMRVVFSDNQRAHRTRNQRSGRIDARTLGKRGWSGDDRLFGRKINPTKKDYFVAIFLDVSGSTNGVNLKMIKEAALAQAELCHRMGIAFAVYAHTGSPLKMPDSDYDWGNMWVDLYEVKAPDQGWDDKARAALLELNPSAANLDGHTLEFARKLVEAQTQTNKIILYYSDGAMPLENHDEELEILQREIAHCRMRRIGLAGVGVRTDSPSRHGLDTVQIDDSAEVGKVVTHLERHIMS